MSTLPLCLCIRISSLSSPNRRLSAVGCELPCPLSSSRATFARSVQHKSFICNAYKKHRGVGEYSPFFPRRSSFVAFVTRRNAGNPNPLMHLLHNSRTPRGGGYDSSEVRLLFPPSGACPLSSPPKSYPQPSTFNFQLSTFGSFYQARFTSHDHGSRITPP